MRISRRTVPAFLGAAAMVGLSVTSASAAGEDDVAKRLEAFRTAQVAEDKKAFDSLCMPQLSYSHSDGRVEDKATFIANSTSGKNPFTKLEYRNPSITVVGDVATVRFNWVGEQKAVADGKVSNTNLHILMTWKKQGADWQLLSRGSTRL